MKKSEKIEVRLSHDEKQKLTEIADGEGRSVSELVRGLISRYMAVNAPIVKKTTWGKIMVVAVAGLLLGHLGTWGLMRAHDKEHGVMPDVYKLSVDIWKNPEKPEFEDFDAEVIFLAKHDSQKTIQLNGETTDFELTTRTTILPDALPILSVNVCERFLDECLDIASQDLTVVNTTKIRAKTVTDDGTTIRYFICNTAKENC